MNTTIVMTDSVSRIKEVLKEYLKNNNRKVLDEYSHKIITEQETFILVNISNIHIAGRGYRPSLVIIDKRLKIADYFDCMKPFIDENFGEDTKQVFL